MLPVNIAKGKSSSRALGELLMLQQPSVLNNCSSILGGLQPLGLASPASLRYSPYTVPQTSPPSKLQPQYAMVPSIPVSVATQQSSPMIQSFQQQQQQLQAGQLQQAMLQANLQQLQLLGVDVSGFCQQQQQQQQQLQQQQQSQSNLSQLLAGQLSCKPRGVALPQGGQQIQGYNMNDLLNLQNLQGIDPSATLQVPIGL